MSLRVAEPRSDAVKVDWRTYGTREEPLCHCKSHSYNPRDNDSRQEQDHAQSNECEVRPS